jgi:hypothetical protein
VKLVINQSEKIKEIETILEELKSSENESSAAIAVDHKRKTRFPTWKVGKSFISLWKSKFILLLVLFVLLISGAGIGVYTLLSGSTFQEEKGSFVEQIQDMSSLATAQGFVKAVIEQEDNKLFGKDINADIPGTKRKILIVVPGSVLAGVDLQKVSENDIKVDEEAKEVTMTLPKAEILQDPSLDMENIKTFSVEGLFRSEVDWQEGFGLAEEAKEQIRREAVGQGILEAAEKNAEKSLKSFFEQIGYSIKVEYKS